MVDSLPADATEAQRKLVASLTDLGQAHLFDQWPPAGQEDTEKQQMLDQLTKLEANYPGGLAAYIRSARNLLGQSVRGENPLQGWSPSVPDDGFDLAPGTAEFAAFEERGLAEAAHLAFAVPAGGLGERLGFSGVKFALPSEVSTGSSVLQVYVSYILAVQRHVERQGGGPCRLPLAIMVSDDTAVGIQQLLDANAYFGLEPAQVTLLKQEKVAALADSDARLALKSDFEARRAAPAAPRPPR
jgi:UDP-sugar pyrophosphorylase